MSLMLINPKHRPRKRRKARSAAQRAATARMRAARRSNPAPRRHKRRASSRRHNPIGLSRMHHARRSRRTRRHNPIGGGMGNIGGMVMNGLKGAVGGIAINAVTHFLPAAVSQGNVMYVTRAALAIVIGTVGRRVLGQHARPMAEGALTINFADLINSFGGGKIPGSELHGVGDAYMGEFLSAARTRDALPYAPTYTGHMDTELAGMAEYV